MKPSFHFLVLLALISTSRSETVVLFDAVSEGEIPWVWGTARLRVDETVLTLTESDRFGSSGGTHMDNPLPYLPGGVIDFSVESVVKGRYTLQLDNVKDHGVLESVRLVPSATNTGSRSFSLKDAGFKKPCRTFVIVLAVEGEGAETHIRDLRYSVEILPDQILLDEEFKNQNAWECFDLVAASERDDIRIQTVEGKTCGSMLHTSRLEKSDDQVLYVHLTGGTNATVSVQITSFDAKGQYAGSVDAVERAKDGWYAVRLDGLRWPEGSVSYQLKLWLVGSDNASAVIDRLMVTN
ncbi:MAG: hypothetical protein KJ626_11480 [Verrucomicrobia bacterium]|nr:hypothetical protein [Verrucomicrobiota bacterium]